MSLGQIIASFFSPMELYEIAFGGQVLRYSTGSRDITVDGEVYEPLPIRRGKLRAGQNMDGDSMEIKVPTDTAFLSVFLSQLPSEVVTVTIKAIDLEDSAPYTASVAWKGRILGVQWETPWATLNCEPTRSSLRRIGLRRTIQRSCPHVLYGTQCGVVKSSYLFVVTCTAKGLREVTLSSFTTETYSDDYFAGGYIEYLDETSNITQRKTIITSVHSTGVYTLMSDAVNLNIGDGVTLIAGCNHTMDQCDRKFGNSENFGGMPFLPNKSPFDGTPIF